MSRATMTRRGFLKSTAAMGAAGALGISAADSLTAVDPAHADEASDVKIIKTSCRACIASCAVLAHVRDGRVVKIEGNPESPMSQGGVCAKGLAGIQALYHPNRNKYPMRRVGERGTNQWERISWEEALTEVATKINEVSDKYGSEAISVSTGGGGNPHFSNVKRFGEAINTPNVWEPGCSQCYLPRMGASLLAYGAGKPNNLSFSDSNGWDYYYTDSPVTSLVLWGTDPSNSSVATGGRALAELRNRPEGLRTVVIDPRYTLDAAKAEAEDILAQWEAGDKTAESFGALAEEYSDDPASNTNGGLYEQVAPGVMFEGFNDWIFADGRAIGDTGLVENPQDGQQGWHIIYLEGWDDPVWKLTGKNALTNEKLNTWLEGLTENMEATQGAGVKYLGE